MRDHRRLSVPTAVDSGLLATDLRVVLGRLMRRLRAEHSFSLSPGAGARSARREGWLAVAIDDGFSADEREVLNRAVSLLARLTEL